MTVAYSGKGQCWRVQPVRKQPCSAVIEHSHPSTLPFSLRMAQEAGGRSLPRRIVGSARFFFSECSFLNATTGAGRKWITFLALLCSRTCVPSCWKFPTRRQQSRQRCKLFCFFLMSWSSVHLYDAFYNSSAATATLSVHSRIAVY